jgi:large subunit ribosomal protein L22
MTGPKLNEASRVAGERTGFRASTRFARVSARKVRPVLDLVRGKDVRSADDILRFTDRDPAILVRKLLASAVANAQHNFQQEPTELYVKAAYADEGPTLKRFRPRARGSAGPILKRTAHVTIVLDRLGEDALAAKAERGGAAASRRARVAASRGKKAEQPAAAPESTEKAE